MQPLAAALAALPFLLLDVRACPTVTTQPGFDLQSYISKRWFIQQQMATTYLPVSQNYCVHADYSFLVQPTPTGYTVQVHNYAQEEDGTPQDSGNFICAAPADSSDAAKLEVGPCKLPRVPHATSGPYWVLAYSEDEGYALVSGGQPTITAPGGCRTGAGANDSGLWIFTRRQQRDEALVQKVRAVAAAKGFDLSVLNDVDQTNCTEAAAPPAPQEGVLPEAAPGNELLV